MKLVIEEPESAALEDYLIDEPILVTSRIALVEVTRATGLANPRSEVRGETTRLLASCMLVDVSDGLLRAAAALTSRSVRTLDAIHLATLLRSEADELAAYDRRLVEAAAQHGLAVASPGVGRVG